MKSSLRFFIVAILANWGLSCLLANAQPVPPIFPPLRRPKPVASKPLSDRALQVAVAADAPAPVRTAAAKILAAMPQNSLMQFMAGNHPLTSLSDSVELAKGPAGPRAFDHLIVVGLPTDPLIDAAWSREAKFDGEDAYIFGYGYLHGDIGYVESDRNPFLHSLFVEKALYETQIIIVTGTTPRGVEIAADSFLKGLINGVVAPPGWKRTQENLLQRDPLPADWTPPAIFPAEIGEWKFAGLTQPNEDEYRGVEARTKVVAQQIWRAKYVKPGVWDHSGVDKAFDNYYAGLHRRAAGNTLWAARWDSPAQAKKLIDAIVREAQLKLSDQTALLYKGAQPTYAYRTDSMGDLASWPHQDMVWMSTLPESVTNQFRMGQTP